MDHPFPGEAEQSGAARLVAILFRIAKIGERTVDRVETLYARGDRDAVAMVMVEVAEVVVGFADARHPHTLARRVVVHAEDQRFQPRRGRGDFLDAVQRLDLLDQHLDADLARDAMARLQHAEQAVDEDNVLRSHDLGTTMTSSRRRSPRPAP